MNPLRLYCKQSLLLTFFLFLFLLSTGRAEDNFAQANQAYMKGDFTSALKDYQTAASHGLSASLLYNMGNCYARLEKTGQAVLAYRQALLFDHFDPDIRTNLETTLKENGIYLKDHPWWRRPADFLGADQWLLLSGASFSLFCACLLLIILGRKKGLTRILKLVAGGALMTTLLALPPAGYGYLHRQDGVVLIQTRLKISPFAEAAPTGAIKEGQIVHPLKTYKGFILVRDINGRKGWLSAQELGFIGHLKNTPTQ